MKVLVAYASRHGATRGIAERIGQTLERNGLDVTVSSVTEVGDPRRFDAFIIGSAAYAFHWLSDATTFVRRHRALLAGHPAWLFSSGPVGADKVDKQGRDVLQTTRPREFTELVEAIHPRGEQVFFGAYDPDAPPSGTAERLTKFLMRFMPSMRNSLPAGDFRDWPAIEAWADGIAHELRPTGTPASPDAIPA
jgi:menaquinone-dependent protoporphyrinogen oxidase